MKRVLFGLGFLVLAKLCFATVIPGEGQVNREVQRPDQHMSEAVYQSSQTCSGSGLQTVFISSPAAVDLYAISVTSAGTAGAYIEVFDALPATAAARRVAFIDSRVTGFYPFNVSFSSWLAVSNQGEVQPACISILHRVR